MTCPCGCCQGVEALTPANTYNRPGLDAISYRVGTHSSFFETMQARLSGIGVEIPATDPAAPPQLIYPTRDLRTRELSDPSMALLDAWATVADILTFYLERIANEGYLGTATHRCSVLELARLVGYRLRPGVSASVFLAFTLDQGKDSNVDMEIDAGTRAQSLPDPGQLPQAFETSEKLAARTVWNNLGPRTTRPQLINDDPNDLYFGAPNISTIYLQGTATNLKSGDPLLIVLSDATGDQFLRFIESVEPDSTNNRTKVVLQGGIPIAGGKFTDLQALVGQYKTAFDASIPNTPLFPAGYVIGQIESLLSDLYSQLDQSKAVSQLQDAVSSLQQYRAIVAQRNLTRLQTWIDNLIQALSSIQEILAAGSGMHTLAFTESAPGPAMQERSSFSAFTRLDAVVKALAIPPSQPPRDAAKLVRSVPETFVAASDALPQLLKTLRPEIAGPLYRAWNSQSIQPGVARVYALRVHAKLFGNNAAPRVVRASRGTVLEWGDWPIFGSEGSDREGLAIPHDLEAANTIYLDSSYEQIVPGSWLAMSTSQTADPTDNPWFLTYDPSPKLAYMKAGSVQANLSRTAYGMSGKTTQIDLLQPAVPNAKFKWFNDLKASKLPGDNFWAVRNTVVYAQSEELALAEEPLDGDVQGGSIELAELYGGLQAGRWIIVSGARTDVSGAGAVPAAELAMLAGVNQGINPKWPGDPIHTTLQLAKPLSYSYDPATVTIYGNVVKATHGETRNEVLGSGSGSKILQSFTLSKPPLTYLSAPTASGAQSTLEVRVNGILWQEVESLSEMDAGTRTYFTKEDHDQKTSAIFGDSEHGARLPTGKSNVKAVYRSGIGSPGNVAAEKISQLVMRPLGVKDVINPLPATGGADPDALDQARRNTPIAVMALDRLLSIEDYAFFARAYAGIAKASSVRLPVGGARVMHVTIAGVGDIPIDRSSDLFQNLALSMQQFGDPLEPIQLDLRSAKLLVISAQVRVLPDYLWENVAPVVRAAMLQAFGFDNRDLGQDAKLGEVFAAIQQVEGVQYIKVNSFGAVSDTDDQGNPVSPSALATQVDKLVKTVDPKNLPSRMVASLATPGPNGILPAQIAYLSDKVPDCLLLTEITG